MQNYQEIIQKNIKEMPFLYCNAEVDVEQWHTQSLISYLEEENKRLEESKWTKENCPISKMEYEIQGVDFLQGKVEGRNQAINEQVEHNKNVIKYLKEL